MRFKQLCVFFYVMLSSIAFGVYGQSSDTLPNANKLTIRPGLMDRINQFAQKEARSSMEDVELDKAVITQYRVLELVKSNMQKAKLYLRNGIQLAPGET